MSLIMARAAVAARQASPLLGFQATARARSFSVLASASPPSAHSSPAPTPPQTTSGLRPGFAGAGEPYDVLIVGGGVSGTALLYELSSFTSEINRKTPNPFNLISAFVLNMRNVWLFTQRCAPIGHQSF